MSLHSLAFVVVLAAVFASESSLIYLQTIFCVLGAASAIALPALGGATITPASLFLPFFAFRVARRRDVGKFVRGLSRSGVWLALLVGWGVLSAILLPRALAGHTQVQTVDRTSSDLVTLISLRPVSGNITQTAYLIGDAVVFYAAQLLLNDRRRVRWLVDAVFLLAALNILAALLNLAEFWLGAPSILPYFRTAGYAVFDTYEEAGMVRIQGTFAETSAFSAFTLPLFAFTLNCWTLGIRPKISGSLALILLALLLTSTSGTAYTGLFLYLCCFCLALIFRGMAGELRRVTALVAALTVGLSAICCILIFEPHWVNSAADFLQATVANKLESSSGVERTSWNYQAWRNFVESWGLGVGLGSARASSFPLVLLSNLGLLGGVLFAGFTWEVLRTSRGSIATPWASAARHAIIASLVAASISGTIFDLGIMFYLFAAACATPIIESESAFASEPIPNLGRALVVSK